MNNYLNWHLKAATSGRVYAEFDLYTTSLGLYTGSCDLVAQSILGKPLSDLNEGYGQRPNGASL